MTVTCAKYEPLVPKRNPPPLSLCWRQKGNQSGPCDPGCTDSSEHCVPVYWATDCKSFTFKGRKKKRPWLFISLLKRKTWITKFEITRLLYFTSANIKFFQVFGYTDLKQEHKKPSKFARHELQFGPPKELLKVWGPSDLPNKTSHFNKLLQFL